MIERWVDEMGVFQVFFLDFNLFFGCNFSIWFVCLVVGVISNDEFRLIV